MCQAIYHKCGTRLQKPCTRTSIKADLFAAREIHHPSDAENGYIPYCIRHNTKRFDEVRAMVVSRIRVLVVDDQQRARQSLTALLTIDPYIQEVRQAAGGSQALVVVEQSTPDLILMDARMPDMDGTQATRAIKQRWPHIKIFVLSMYVEYRNEALEAGADAFITKGGSPDHLLALIHDVASAPPS